MQTNELVRLKVYVPFSSTKKQRNRCFCVPLLSAFRPVPILL